MKLTSSQNPGPPPPDGHRVRWPRFLAVGCVLAILIALLLPREHGRPMAGSDSASGATTDSAAESPTGQRPRFWQQAARSDAATAPTAEEIVSGKVRQFGRSRREIVRAIARRSQKDIPPEVERFFDAIESGLWEEIDAQWNAMAKRSAQYEGSTHSPELDPFWMAVLDAYGVAEQAHDWPAQKLLDYGNAVLGSLRPGMVYVGGTDNGRWIPELLNETSGGEPHVIVTQNALADARYVEYMKTLYGDQMATLTDEDSKRAFHEYVTDAQKRLEHDQQFPDEPKQIRPGENVTFVDGKIQVGGQIAVTSINEKLLQTLMAKNPDVPFAIQESSPLKGTYADALPLGPLMELRAQDGQNTFTPERATQSLDYWRNTAQQILSDPEAAGSPAALKSYSHDTVAAANLLAAHNFTTEAEQVYRLASELQPSNAEAIFGLSKVLTDRGRPEEARRLLDDFARNYPKQRRAVDTFRSTITATAKD